MSGTRDSANLGVWSEEQGAWVNDQVAALPAHIQTVLESAGRTLVLIDGANTYQSSKHLGFDIDYKELHEMFRRHTKLLRIYYFTVFLENQEENVYNVLKPLTDWMSYNNYSVVTKLVKSLDSPKHRAKSPLFIDVELTTTALQQLPNYDTVVIFSGDGDFTFLSETLKNYGKRVIVVGTLSNAPSIIADSLRRSADYVIFLEELDKTIQRNPNLVAKRRATTYKNLVVTD